MYGRETSGRVGWAVGNVLLNLAQGELGGSEVNLVVMGTNEGKSVKSLKSYFN